MGPLGWLLVYFALRAARTGFSSAKSYGARSRVVAHLLRIAINWAPNIEAWGFQVVTAVPGPDQRSGRRMRMRRDDVAGANRVSTSGLPASTSTPNTRCVVLRLGHLSYYIPLPSPSAPFITHSQLPASPHTGHRCGTRSKSPPSTRHSRIPGEGTRKMASEFRYPEYHVPSRTIGCRPSVLLMPLVMLLRST